MAEFLKYKSRNNTTCCISPSRGITVISIISGINGSCITLLTLLALYQKTSPLQLQEGCKIVTMLIIIGLFSSLSSFWVLLSKGNRTSVKIWTLAHILNIATILILFKNLLMADYDISDLLYGLLSFIGIYFCQIVFCTLVMIDFLTRSSFDDRELIIDHEGLHNSYFIDDAQLQRDLDFCKVNMEHGNIKKASE